MSIYDIPIAEILEQYMEVLHEAEHMDLDVAGDFIAMAAQLVYIKSRMLLPKHEEDEGRGGPASGSGRDAARVSETQERDCVFAEKNETGRDIYVKPPERQDDAPVEYHYTVNDLIRAANKMLRRTKRRLPPPVTSFQGIVGREPAPVEGRVTVNPQALSVPDARAVYAAVRRCEKPLGDCGYLSGCAGIIQDPPKGTAREMELMLTNDNTKNGSMTALEAGLEAVALFAAGDAVTIERLSAAPRPPGGAAGRGGCT